MNKLSVLGATASVLVSSIVLANQHQPIAKHLAGPAEEIELMQKASPESTAIVSKHAMLKVDLTANAQGEYSWQKNVLIDGDNPKVLLFSPDREAWQLTIADQLNRKDGQPLNIGTEQTETEFGMAAERFPATQFNLQNLSHGRYQFNVTTAAKQAAEGYLLISSDSPYRLSSYHSQPGYLVGSAIEVNATAHLNDDSFSVVKSDHQLIQNAYVLVTAPDGQQAEYSLFDDGLAADKQAFDGLYQGAFVAEQAGLYQVQVLAKGLTPEGLPFERTVEHVIPVIASDLTLEAKHVAGQYSAEHKIDLNIAVDTADADARYRVTAEVWTQDANKQAAEAVTWLSTISGVSDGQLKLQLDDRWLMAQNIKGPYLLKNLRVEDLNHYITVLEANELPLSVPAIPEQAKASYDGQLTQSMLMGEKPQRPQAANKAGGKLMLVHGYCSGDAWGPVQSQFSNSVKFTDYNQNRSHDQFAQLIDSYGDNFPSFGVVAHSQGGAASLHLYTYYWSGLDDADPGRLIQSVGTPYQGTPLAGNLALIGDIFGVGCGYNSNLTTSGASSWLSGIPTWARSKVNYYTTSFTDKWWRYDYCNIASDLVLSDPEDGTTEKSRGQLSGAVNRGHKTGQCHTTGMRDMPQTRDSGRNGTMSANAAR